MKESPYITWAKRHHRITYNLASSGVSRAWAGELAFELEDLARTGEQEDGWPPLLERIAQRYGVQTSNVVLAPGASMANYLVSALLIEPGDTVLVEHPVYEPLRLLPRHFRAEVRLFERRADDGYAFSPAAIERLVDDRTRLLICTNLHNPTGTLAARHELETLASLGESLGFHVLVDEVYLDWLYEEGERTAALLSPSMIATRSLTKVFGLDTLRMGWILADADTAERLRRLIDLFYVKMPHPIERMAARAFDRADDLLRSLTTKLEENFAVVKDFVDRHSELSWSLPVAGPIGWIRLETGSVEVLVQRLEKLDTLVAPGRFFDVDDHFRLGFGMEKEILVEGLRRLDKVLEEL